MKVRIKTWEKIEKTLDEYHKTGMVYFNPHMKEFCGRVLDGDYENVSENIFDCGWTWHTDWLEPIKQKLTVEIDPDNPTEAHRIVSEAIKQYRYGWTEDEIAEAIRVTDEEIMKKGVSK